MSDHLYTTLLLPFLLVCFLVQPASIGRAEELHITQKDVRYIEQTYQNMTSLSFQFQQKTRSGGRDRLGAGKAVFYRPGNSKDEIMRWDYTEPDKQVILKNGDKLSIYSEQDNQLIITSANDVETDIIYGFFAGTRQITDDFTSAVPDDQFVFHLQGTPLHILKLVPALPHPKIKFLQIWYDDLFLIHHLIMEDHFDSITELTFSEIVTNALPAHSAKTIQSLTWLNLPDNTEIISQ